MRKDGLRSWVLACNACISVIQTLPERSAPTNSSSSRQFLDEEAAKDAHAVMLARKSRIGAKSTDCQCLRGQCYSHTYVSSLT